MRLSQHRCLLWRNLQKKRWPSTGPGAPSHLIPTNCDIEDHGPVAALEALPAHVRARARSSYRLFKDNPSHPSLQFKPVHPQLPIYSARIGLGHRAVATVDGDEVVWFWIGTHPEYERLLKQL